MLPSSPEEALALIRRLPAAKQREALALLRALPVAPKFDLDAILFPKQRAFVRDSSKWRTAVCSRRAGKTIGAAAALIDSALSHPGSANLYITRSRKNAKRIFWTPLKKLIRDNKLDAEPNESDLCIKFGNGSRIYLAGANDRDAIEDQRGDGMAMVVIDECQSLPAYLENLVDEVLVPALMDYDGSLILIGTPGPVPVGYFFDATQSEAWSHHHWTVHDNPHILAKSGKTPAQHLQAELVRRGLSEADPVIQREWWGKWIHDPNSLVFRFDGNRNTYTELPSATGWEYVIGIDLGYEDADAISVLGWHPKSPNVWQVEEHVLNKQTVTQLGETLRPLLSRYQPVSTVIDSGGLGKKIAEELSARLGIHLKAAEKTRKIEYIELVNDALRTGRLQVRPESRFASDALLIEWDRNRSTPDRRVISDRYHSDIADALLYAFRESLHWLHEPPEEKPQPGTDEWAREEEDRMIEAMERRLRLQDDDPWAAMEEEWWG